jgi:hypothetical protein
MMTTAFLFLPRTGKLSQSKWKSRYAGVRSKPFLHSVVKSEADDNRDLVVSWRGCRGKVVCGDAEEEETSNSEGAGNMCRSETKSVLLDVLSSDRLRQEE